MSAELEEALARGRALTVLGRLEAAEETIQRRTGQLAAALHAPDSATWPELVAMAAVNVDQCSTNVNGSGERCAHGAHHPGECES